MCTPEVYISNLWKPVKIGHSLPDNYCPFKYDLQDFRKEGFLIITLCGYLESITYQKTRCKYPNHSSRDCPILNEPEDENNR